MGIHTFGDYPEKYHPHLHAIVTEGLFTENGTFYIMPKVDSKPLEEIFRARVFTMLKKKSLSIFLYLWTEVPSRAPPPLNQESQAEVVYEPFDDGWPGFDEIAIG